MLQGLRGSIPPNFPYLNVEFGISGGIVHVIADESKFDRSRARNVMIGGLHAKLLLPQESVPCRHTNALLSFATLSEPSFRTSSSSCAAGLLGLPQEDMHRRARQESVAIQSQWAAEMRKQFEPFDWTRALE